MGLCFWKGSRWQSFNFNFADKRVNDKDLLAVWRIFFYFFFIFDRNEKIKREISWVFNFHYWQLKWQNLIIQIPIMVKSKTHSKRRICFLTQSFVNYHFCFGYIGKYLRSLNVKIVYPWKRNVNGHLMMPIKDNLLWALPNNKL